MPHATVNNVSIHYLDEGPRDGAPVVFSNSLGTDLHLWDPILPYLPDGLRLIRYDKRGHGKSDCPPAPYSMGMLIRDTEALLDHLQVQGCVFVGLSIGGLIAQGLAVKRLDLIRAAVLSNTGAKLGTSQMWGDRIAAIRAGGLEAICDVQMERWFSRNFLSTDAFSPWREMFLNTPNEGYIGCCHAISGTDFLTSTSGLRLPVLGIAGSEDGATPPDLVRETINLIPGAQFELIRQTGHLPCVERPDTYSVLITDFLRKTGHL